MRFLADHQRLLMALVFILVGGVIVFGAYGVGPMAGAKMNAPRWIVALGGVVFVAGGVLLLEPSHYVGQVFGGLTVVALTVVSAWVAVFGEPEFFSGGLPFLSPALNVALGRVLFALIAVLGIAIIVFAASRLFRRQDP